MTGSLVIVSRFCGPPDSGNGGYVWGLSSATSTDLRKLPFVSHHRWKHL
jgi:hypothetical protein